MDGLRGRGIIRDTGHFVRCVRCGVEVPHAKWPWHGSLDDNRCVSAWERQVEARAAAAKANKRKTKR